MMLVREMDTRECQELLARLGFGRLACAHENQPYIVPTYFAAQPDRIYGFATLGQKIEWMRSNPLVCIEADEVKGQNDWASVVVFGRFEEFPDTPEYAYERRRAQGFLEKRVAWWQTAFGAAQTRNEFDRDLPVVYCIRIHKITGRQVLRDPPFQSPAR